MILLIMHVMVNPLSPTPSLECMQELKYHLLVLACSLEQELIKVKRLVNLWYYHVVHSLNQLWTYPIAYNPYVVLCLCIFTSVMPSFMTVEEVYFITSAVSLVCYCICG